MISTCSPLGTSRLEKLLKSVQNGDESSEELLIPQGLRDRLYLLSFCSFDLDIHTKSLECNGFGKCTMVPTRVHFWPTIWVLVRRYKCVHIFSVSQIDIFSTLV